MPARRYVKENDLSAMLAAKMLAGVAPEVNLREHVTQAPPPSENKVIHSGLEIQRRCHESPKQGYQWPLQKTLVSYKDFF